MAIHPVDMAILEAMVQDMLEDHKMIVLARRYYQGDQDVYLDARMSQFLNLHSESPFRFNVCKTVVNALRDELSVIGFDTDEATDKEGRKAQAEFAANVWNANRMDAMQGIVHKATLRDRETFVIVDYDDVNKRARLTHNQRFTDVGANGDGTGCWIVYENDDPNQPARAAVKQWTEIIFDEGGQPTFQTRRTIYFPDHIEKWVYDDTWVHLVEDFAEGEDDELISQWPVPWVDKKGKPLGIPVIHFKNEDLLPEHWEAIPMQDAINKWLIDVLASGDMVAFAVFVALGFYPTTDGQPPAEDGSNLIPIQPGSWVGSTKGPNDASVNKLEGSDPTPMINAFKDLILLTAQITDTPVSRFVASAQVASSETIKEQDRPLKKKAVDRRVTLGNSWEDCMVMARKLSNFFGNAGLDESVQFSTLWSHSESLDELQQKKNLGVPQETIWAEMGYSPEQIAAMKETREYKLLIEKLIWDAAISATQAGMPLEGYLLRQGFTAADLQLIGTQKLAAIKAQQEDVIPPTGQ